MANNQIKIKEDATNILQTFLGNHKDSYFIIGGHAAAYNLSLQSLSFRATKDYDIVIVSEVNDGAFAHDLAELLITGGYEFGYKSDSKKRIAYRFESPSDGRYPEIIEFFVKEGENIQSLDERFAKLNIVVDEEKISAMVLNKDIYDFSKKHVIEINNLMFIDKPCLLALKSYAYFENLKLYKEGKVKSDDYKKHAKDILRILLSFSESEIVDMNDLPEILKQSLRNIIPILTSSKDQLKTFGLSKEFITDSINSLAGIK